jgi:hypothetical protein
MLKPEIIKLTREQEDLIPVYQDKWKQIILSTERIDRDAAIDAVKQAYALMNLPEPEIFFYESLRAIGFEDKNFLDKHQIFGVDFTSKLVISIESHICNQISKQIKLELQEDLFWKFHTLDDLGNISFQITRDADAHLCIELYKYQMNEYKSVADSLNIVIDDYKDKFIDLLMLIDNYYPEIVQKVSDNEIFLNLIFGNDYKFIDPLLWGSYCSFCDYCINVINCEYDQKEWELLQSVAINWGWVLPLEKQVIICEKPLKYSFDSNYNLHAEGEAAVEFADGHSIYAYHGAVIPEKYGKLHPKDWKPQWLLEEDNAELRRVLIQGIGYARIIEELQATELDSYQEYTLLKIDSEVDVEPIYLLKMICPSTGHIHALRVPPNTESAYAAITWVNSDIPPEDFAIQT